ncbi:MAG: DUF1800 domain-containing protein [Pseudomonadota bacterium]
MSAQTSVASVALNRFGYGIRRGAEPPGDPMRSLLRQFDAYDPSPIALKDREDTSSEAGKILQMIRENRRNRKDSASEMSESMRTSNPITGLPTDVKRAYVRGGEVLRHDIALRTNIAVTSDAPMVERLVHFWSNHFSVSAGKPGTQHQVGNHEFGAIRPYVLGKFSDMLRAAVLHPAMLLYLDQFQSVGPNSQFQKRRRGRNQNGPRGLNENLAREILELHTLGVDGGYSQTDVTEFARALTGWTIPGLSRIERFSELQPTGAAFVRLAHEPGSRKVLGNIYRDNGPSQAVNIIDDLATHPSTARFVATKLARHFAGDDPPAGLVTRLETDFRRTGGDLASLSRTLIEAPEVWTEEPVKFRQPYEWLIAVLRMTGVEGLSARRVSGALRELGQVPWRAPSPAGYDDKAGSWAGPDALYRRVELAEQIARNAPSENLMARAEAAFPGALSDNTRLWLSRAESGAQGLGLLLVAPEMMRR